MKRITPDEVVEAYRRTGWRPIQKAFFDFVNGQHCGCGLSVLIGDAKKVLQMDARVRHRELLFADELGLTPNYVCGFILGFDGETFSFNHKGEMYNHFEMGYQDGRACWEAVKREVLGIVD